MLLLPRVILWADLLEDFAMARAFANISFTPNVKKVQSDMGSRENYQKFEMGENELVQLSDFEKQFISARDSFYQATISENGWPYVQHRGGPKGFMKILDDTTIGFADFSGNRQYLSVGNLLGDDRISIIFMDYLQKARLKIWGRARLIDELTDPELIAQLEPENSRAPIERGIVIKVEAFDWNCPKYITPRYTEDDLKALLPTLKASQTQNQAYDYKGTGTLPLVITAIKQVATDIRSYEFSALNGHSLPHYEAGAHITLPIQLANGSKTSRAYSLTSPHSQNGKYEIAVKKESNGEGGSSAIHQHWQVGTEINIDPHKNYFSLHNDQRHTVFIAGGIGITPIKAMVETLSNQQRSFELHYTGKSKKDMAFIDELSEQFNQQSHFYFSTEPATERLNLQSILKRANNSIFYVCGPKKLLNECLNIAEQLGIARNQIQFESFQ